MSPATVRYMVDDVDAAVAFYSGQLGFEVALRPDPSFAILRRGDLRLLLSGLGGPGGAAQPMPDGSLPEPGGWNRIQIEVDDVDARVERLRAAGARLRGDVVTGRGGRQALVEDPAGNPVELLEPAWRERPRPAEARLAATETGAVPEGDGWFVVNIADARAHVSESAGYAWLFEATPGAFPHLGINVHVLSPGEPASKYHAEDAQEAFLVLRGECVLVVEDEERRLRQWDFFHCPPGTAHVLVGGGDGPCAILMVGARHAGRGLVYPVSEAAARYGASVAQETTSGRDAYADWRPPEPGRRPWPPD
jgi:uncharacterized cupin superfamily protein/catechol 2,3-dioxygenase-like lactoylglutathione lyase family enzyme